MVSLYLASKLDPHFLVRDAANDALAVLIVCRRECYLELSQAANELAKQLRGKYQPTKGECVRIFEEICAACSAP